MRSVRSRAAALLIALLGLTALFSDGLERTLAHPLFAAYQALTPRQGVSAPRGCEEGNISKGLLPDPPDQGLKVAGFQL